MRQITGMPKCRKSNGKPKNISYWSEEIGVLREEALESDWLWEGNRKPYTRTDFRQHAKR